MSREYWKALLLVTCLGMMVLIYTTPFGAGLVNDSVGYIAGARNLLQGNGYSRLTGNGTAVAITNYPPLFSVLIAAVSGLGTEAANAAHMLNIIFFGMSIFLFGLMIFWMTGSPLLCAMGAGLFMISTPFLKFYSLVMSEPLYLVLNFFMLLFLVKHFESDRWGWLAGAGLAAGLAFLTRYVGISLFGLALMAELLFTEGRRKIITRGTLFLAWGLPLPIAWIVRNFQVSQNAGNRVAAIHLIPLDKVREGAINFWGWLLPEWGGILAFFWPLMALAFLSLLGGFTWWCYREWRSSLPLRASQMWRWSSQHPQGLAEGKRPFLLAWMLAALAVIYMGVLVFTLTFLDASPIFEHRILSPIYISVLGLLMLGVGWMWKKKSRRWRLGAAAGLLVLSLFLVEDTIDTLRDLHADGQGYAGTQWRESPTIAYARDLPKTLIYSNKVNALYILANRPAYVLPSPFNPATGQARQDYEDQLQKIRETILQGRGIMVILDTEEIAQGEEGRQWLADLTDGLPVIQEFNDGIILGVKQP